MIIYNIKKIKLINTPLGEVGGKVKKIMNKYARGHHPLDLSKQQLVDCRSVSRTVNGEKEILSIGTMVKTDVDDGYFTPILKFDIYHHPDKGVMIRAITHRVCYDIYTDINDLILTPTKAIRR